MYLLIQLMKIKKIFTILQLLLQLIIVKNILNKTNRKENKMLNLMQYKYEEIKSYFEDFIEEHDQKWIKENFDDLHHEAFNTDYYIIGTQDAIDWLGSEVFNVIQIIKEYEQSNFGEVTTDFSDPERIVNMYAYIIGETIVEEYKLEFEKSNNKKIYLDKAHTQLFGI